MADKMLKITLVKSTIGAVPKHKKTVEAMGLTKLNKTVLMLPQLLTGNLPAESVLLLLHCQAKELFYLT